MNVSNKILTFVGLKDPLGEQGGGKGNKLIEE